MEGPWEQRPGGVLVRAPPRSLLCFPRPSGQGPFHTSALRGGQPWLGTGAQAESLTPQGSEGVEPGRHLTWPLPADWEPKAGQGTHGGRGAWHPRLGLLASTQR